jgi:hypothetical protein
LAGAGLAGIILAAEFLLFKPKKINYTSSATVHGPTSLAGNVPKIDRELKP